MTGVVEGFVRDFGGPTPAFMYVPSRDWRWLLTFAPSLRGMPVAGHEAVGSRQVLLIANEAGKRLVDEETNRSPVGST
jgi:hypothetical protein